MIREIVNSNMTRREARAALVAAGWGFVGGGSFAAVYGSPDGTRVAKVTKPDSGAEATYRVSTRLEGNPHLPHYFDRVPLANGGHVYEVERLIPFTSWDDLDAAKSGTDEYSEAWGALNAEWGEVNDYHWRNAMRRSTGELVMTDYLADMQELSHAAVSAAYAEDGLFEDPGRSGSDHWRDAA